MGILEKIKGMFKPQENDDAPPREIRDRHLESLEREWTYHEMQKRKELLQKKLKALHKKHVAEKVFGKYQPEKNNILKAKLCDSGVDLTKEKYQLLKAKRLFK